MGFIRKNGKYYIAFTGIVLCMNLYFLFLVPGMEKKYLYYFDFLSAIFIGVFWLADFLEYKKKNRKKRELLACDGIIYKEFPGLYDADIMEHDANIYERQVEEGFEKNAELQDYVAKWGHEIKIPLAAAMLINEKMEDIHMKSDMKNQLERINWNLNSLLLGCKLNSSLLDIQIKKTFLKECVKMSVSNHQYFLIQKNFRMEINVGEVYVYSDPSWVVYILDQLIANAVKYTKVPEEWKIGQIQKTEYAREEPRLNIWTECEGKPESQCIRLYVRDNGEGIRQRDIRRIFEKGYTGSNHHNGQYKSTGMGLYMVATILKKLEHEIEVESECGKYTQFCIRF